MNVDTFYEKLRRGMIDSLSEENSNELLEKIKKEIVKPRNSHNENIVLDEILIPYFNDPLSIVQKETMIKLQEKLKKNRVFFTGEDEKSPYFPTKPAQYIIKISPNSKKKIKEERIKKWREF